MPKMPRPAPRSPSSIDRRRTTTPVRSVSAAAIASRSASEEWRAWRASVNGPWGMRYLPHADSPEADEEQSDTEGEAERPRLPVLPVRRAEHPHADHADEEVDGDGPLGPLRVDGGDLEVRVVEIGDVDRRGLVVGAVGHDRSPIQ